MGAQASGTRVEQLARLKGLSQLLADVDSSSSLAYIRHRKPGGTRSERAQ
jgi:hypothetical protein